MTRRKQRGFTLVEVLVAFSVLVVVLALLYQIGAGSLERQRTAEAESRALALAQAILTRVGEAVLLREGTTSGTWNEGLSWQLTITPDPDPASRLWLYEVQAEITSEGKSRPFVLTAWRLGPAEGEEE